MKIFIGMPVHREMTGPTQLSMLATFDRCHRANVTVGLWQEIGNPYVALARNMLAHKFFKSECDVLFWIDSDIEWKPEDVISMSEECLRLNAIIGATYRMKEDDLGYLLLDFPVDHDKVEQRGNYITYPDISFGLGFTVVPRGIMQGMAWNARMIKAQASDELFPELFRTGLIGNRFAGEDAMFYREAHELGHPVWLDISKRLGHVGQKSFMGALGDMKDA